jgi:hypothetical protein
VLRGTRDPRRAAARPLRGPLDQCGLFLVESVAGLVAHSTSLLADSADMLGDAIVYGFSLYVVSKGLAWQAHAAMLKGVIMAAFARGCAGSRGREGRHQ